MSNGIDELVLYIEKYSHIKYNTKVENTNYNIVVLSGGKIRRLNGIEKGYLNLKKPLIFYNHIYDPNQYIVCFIRKNCFDGKWGGNIPYLEQGLDNVQEKIYIRIKYSYSIINPLLFINFISLDQNKYFNRLITIKINNKIDAIIKSSISEKIKKVGFIELQDSIFSVSKEIENKINEQLIQFGINIKGINIELEESIENYSKRACKKWQQVSAKLGEINNETIQEKNEQ